MTPNKKIIKFMEMKAGFIEKNTLLPVSTYFNESDKKIIQEWSEEDAALVWIDVLSTVITIYDSEGLLCAGLYPGLCPFCLMHDSDCDECPYAETHNGSCSDNEDSDFVLVLRELKESGATFNKAVYINMIKQINAEPWEVEG